MLMYRTIAHEWDRLNRLTKEEMVQLNNSIEDGAFQAFSQFNNQLMNDLSGKSPEVKNLKYEEVEKIRKAIGNALYSGYLIFAAYQFISGLNRPTMRIGIQYNPALMNEYNDAIAPLQPNEKNRKVNDFLDMEPAIELLIEKVAGIEMNILKKDFVQLESMPYIMGDMVKGVIGRGVFIGFGISYSENNLRA